jgi:hypothetical protein
MVTRGPAGRPAKRRVSQRFHVKVGVGAYHGNFLE